MCIVPVCPAALLANVGIRNLPPKPPKSRTCAGTVSGSTTCDVTYTAGSAAAPGAPSAVTSNSQVGVGRVRVRASLGALEHVPEREVPRVALGEAEARMAEDGGAPEPDDLRRVGPEHRAHDRDAQPRGRARRPTEREHARSLVVAELVDREAHGPRSYGIIAETSWTWRADGAPAEAAEPKQRDAGQDVMASAVRLALFLSTMAQ